MAYGSTSNLKMDASRPLKICLFGITGCGKSTLGNVLLGYGPDGDTQGFRTSNSPTGPDSDVVVMDGNLFGDVNRRVCIIDTPGCGKEEAEDKRSNLF
ncbi:unnamed protein product [Darwinula stevensoni]|uniref:G domain-containing protein n=1 Tax=Darwinula stevensoni TaxID=69355 RepID=A0A7R9FRK2_9CRUS|nr:unnamed protein product [Darwinula stevensoni]CAG0901528.1 unnamed protein product [Darwinula stevensoni]